jgi:hypothetical protein
LKILDLNLDPNVDAWFSMGQQFDFKFQAEMEMNWKLEIRECSNEFLTTPNLMTADWS